MLLDREKSMPASKNFGAKLKSLIAHSFRATMCYQFVTDMAKEGLR